jgi:hypothetical protein
LLLYVAFVVASKYTRGSSLSVTDVFMIIVGPFAISKLLLNPGRLRFLLIGKTGLVVCNYVAGPRWYPWDRIERVTFGFIHAKTESGKRRREPMYPGWNVRFKERRALRRYIETVGPPEKLQIDTQP